MDLKAALVVVHLLANVPWTAAQEQDLGPLTECAHGLKGRVKVINERTIAIKGFSYDGKSPAAVFHAMRKGQTKINTIPGTYETIPFTGQNCETITKLPEVPSGGMDIELYLPQPITAYASFGVYCYNACVNLGHVKIPDPFPKPIPSGDAAPSAVACTARNVKEAETECTGDEKKFFYEINGNCEPKPPAGAIMGGVISDEVGGNKTAGSAQLTPTSAGIAICTAVVILVNR